MDGGRRWRGPIARGTTVIQVMRRRTMHSPNRVCEDLRYLEWEEDVNMAHPGYEECDRHPA